MTRTRWLAVVVSVVLGTGALGCGGSGSEGVEQGAVDPKAWSYTEHKFVFDELRLPMNAQDAKQLGFDLDGDGDAENQLGNMLSGLAGQLGSASPQKAINDSLQNGSLLILISLFAQDIQNSTTSNLWAFIGEKQTITALQPGMTFTVDPDGPQSAYFGGRIKDGFGTFGGGKASAMLRIPLSDTGSLDVTLQSVNVEFEVSADGTTLDGRLGGAITENEIDTKVVPEVVRILNDALSDCTGGANCGCTAGSGAATILELFDSDGNCTITADEFTNQGIVKRFLSGDVELADGTMGLSLAVGFHAIQANYDHVAPPQ